MQANQELAGKVAIVTGASRNIGRSIATELARAGATVVINTRRSGAEAEAARRDIEAAGGRAIVALADVTDESAVQVMIDQTIGRFGRLDFLVNNAALRPERTIDDMTLADFRAVVGLILEGAFLCTKAALPHLRRSEGAAIVNLGGMSGHIGSAHRMHVVTGKAGIVGMTKALAIDLAPSGITVNCIVPGLVETVRDGGKLPQAHLDNPSLFGRRARPDEIAAMARYLCGPNARFITGQAIHVNGGAFMP